MATVEIDRQELEDFRLPLVCMRCGGAADGYKSKLFSWSPPWISLFLLLGVLPFLILIAALTRRVRIEVPLCEAHRGHWIGRALFVWLGFASMLGLGFLVWQGCACIKE
jgi:hypothetical protein